VSDMSDAFGGFDPRMFEQVPLFRELAKVMSWSGGPVNWELASQTALALADADSEPAPSDRDHAEFATAVDTAELWLDQVIDLPRVDGPARALTRGEWTRLATTTDGLGAYVEPIAAGAGEGFAEQLPEELSAALGPAGGGNPLAQAMRSLGAMLYGMQTGTVAGHLAGQLLSSYDLGVPTIDPRMVATVGDAAERFAADYAFDQVELRHWLALREAAHRRQYAGVPWLRAELIALVGRFAAEADTSSMFDQLGALGIDPNDPASLQRALEGPDAFSIEPTTGQRQVLERLQAVVSFVIAWVDTVISSAAADKLTALPRVHEAMQRRRAEQGPGERFLTQLVGLDLTPAAVREAQQFCDAVIAARGQEGLDRVWRDRSHLPTPQELADPSRWLVRMAAAELEQGEE
jgi:putative hydrolase